MTIVDLRQQTGVLLQAIEQCTKQALACGALQPISTSQIVLPHGGVEFLVRSVSSLTRKRQAGKKDKPRGRSEFNPFLPPEPELTVADVSDSHLAIMNKFNVIDRHLLILTRRFEHQESLLNLADFMALWGCLQEFDGLGFYNGGRVAGASQRHKHLQLIPLPLAAGMSGTPMDILWSNVSAVGEMISLPTLPFRHAFMALPEIPLDDIKAAATYSLTTYRQMLEQVGIVSVRQDIEEFQSAPYNLLLTRRWMLLVPRAKEFYKGISINALGFAGSLFVPDQVDLETVRRLGPMNILQAVTSVPLDEDFSLD